MFHSNPEALINEFKDSQKLLIQNYKDDHPNLTLYFKTCFVNKIKKDLLNSFKAEDLNFPPIRFSDHHAERLIQLKNRMYHIRCAIEETHDQEWKIKLERTLNQIKCEIEKESVPRYQLDKLAFYISKLINQATEHYRVFLCHQENFGPAECDSDFSFVRLIQQMVVTAAQFFKAKLSPDRANHVAKLLVEHIDHFDGFIRRNLAGEKTGVEVGIPNANQNQNIYFVDQELIIHSAEDLNALYLGRRMLTDALRHLDAHLAGEFQDLPENKRCAV